jgi:hypothetical protein
LLQMPGSKIAAVICIQDFRNPANLPTGILFAPNRLSQSKGGVE